MLRRLSMSLGLVALASVASGEPPPAAPAPPAIAGAIDLMARQGICERGWRELGEPRRHDISPDVAVWLAPCSHWGYNVAWAAFLEFRESDAPGDSLFQPILFLSYAPEQGVHASNVAYNVSWDSGARAIRSTYARNGRDYCGVRAAYAWRESAQAFVAQELAKQDDCADPAAPWTSVLPPDLVHGR